MSKKSNRLKIWLAEINDVDYDYVSDEFDSLLRSLNAVGVKVFLADERYFPTQHRGVYHTVSNNFYLNRDFMGSPATLMSVMRHEGWHAAQDCMAGTIDNNMIAIIMPEEDVPMLWREMVKRTYPKSFSLGGGSILGRSHRRYDCCCSQVLCCRNHVE